MFQDYKKSPKSFFQLSCSVKVVFVLWWFDGFKNICQVYTTLWPILTVLYRVFVNLFVVFLSFYLLVFLIYLYKQKCKSVCLWTLSLNLCIDIWKKKISFYLCFLLESTIVLSKIKRFCFYRFDEKNPKILSVVLHLTVALVSALHLKEKVTFFAYQKERVCFFNSEALFTLIFSVKNCILHLSS